MNSCIICIGENPISEKNPLTDEHIIPEFLGGSLVRKNVCKKCNSTMGTGFEGILANSLFYKLPRFVHDIKGKKSSLENPFSGVYDHEEIGRFRVNENGDLTVIPDVKIEKIENGFAINMTIDKSEIENAKPLLEKKLARYINSQGKDVDRAKISEGVDKLLKEANQKHNKYDKPKFQGRISIDVDAQKMLYCKIAYELAFHHFGESYINDPVAEKLRSMLKTQKPDHSLRGQFPAEDNGFNNFFDDKNHWVMFMGAACFIQLFGQSGIIGYVSEPSEFQTTEGVVYKFCYKSQKYEVIPLTEHISGVTRPSI